MAVAITGASMCSSHSSQDILSVCLEKLGLLGFSTQLRCINSRTIHAGYHSSKYFLNALKKSRKCGIFIRAARQICLGCFNQSSGSCYWHCLVYNVPSIMMALQNKKFFICTAPSNTCYVMVA